MPHLVPSNLVGRRFRPDTFEGTKIALIGYCPPPTALSKYDPAPTQRQYFIHVSPDSVKRLSFKGTQFLSLVHVYGGPVSASTVEELAYYGFEFILAYGLAGGLGTKQLRMGDYYLIEDAFAADGTTPHYTSDTVVACDRGLRDKTVELSNGTELSGLHVVRAYTGDAIYREDAAMLQSARGLGCDVINLDSSHLYAAARVNDQGKSMRAIECGVISDVCGDSDHNWDSSLSTMLSSSGPDEMNPLERTGKIVEFFVERLGEALAPPAV